MGAAQSMALAAATAVVPAAGIFSAGVAVGVRVGVALAAVNDAAEAVIGYLRAAASWAFDKLKAAASWALDKLKAAAAFVKDRVIRLVRRLFGRKEAAAARREMDRAPDGAQAHEVLSRASARVAGSGRRLLDAKHQAAAAPPPSSAVGVSAAAPGGALALHLLGSVAAPAAARAARRASEMMALVEAVYAELRDGIPEDARSCISVVVAAVGIGLEATAAAAAPAYA